MDGDFAPMEELSQLRKMHGLLLVIDDVSWSKMLKSNLGVVTTLFAEEI